MGNAIVSRLGATKDYVNQKLNERMPSITVSDADIYVSTSGSDETGDGSEARPYATINKAIESIPKTVNHTVTVRIADGTYGDYIGVSEFSGLGRLVLQATNAVISSGLSLNNNKVSYIDIRNLSIQYKLSFNYTASNVSCFNCTVGKDTVRIEVVQSNKIYLYECTVKNYADSNNNFGGITANLHSNVIVSGLTVNNVDYAVFSKNGATVSLINDIKVIGGKLNYCSQNCGKIEFAYEKTVSDIDIYVSASGNDAYEGSESRPYKTIEKALSRVPKIINHTVNIHIGDGTFSLKNTAISGFSGSGSLVIKGNDTSSETKTKVTNSLSISKMSVNKIWIGNMTFEFTGITERINEITSLLVLNTCTFKGMPDSWVNASIHLDSANNCVMEYCKVQYSENGVSVTVNSTVRIVFLTAYNVSRAVSVFSGSIAMIRSSITGVGTVYKQADNGGCVIYPNGTFSEN